MEQIFHDKNLSPAQKMILANLVNRSKLNGFCNPSIRQMAFELGLSEMTIMRAINFFQKMGFITKIQRYNNQFNSSGGRLSNIYELTAEFRQKIAQKGMVKNNVPFF